MRLGSLFCLLFLLVGITAAQDTNFPVGPQYLVTFGSPMFARPIATPTLWLDVPLPPIPSLPEVGPVIGNQPYIENPELQHEVDLFPIYYGYPMPSVVELTSAEPPRELPASIVDVGVAGITNAQSLREQGYGVPLGDTASFWKAHKPHAPRVYTNADVERLHGS
ncbi:MAG: hypothetical protein WAN76_15075 [Candidatus Sulfotelmatobacter sp.]